MGRWIFYAVPRCNTPAVLRWGSQRVTKAGGLTGPMKSTYKYKIYSTLIYLLTCTQYNKWVVLTNYHSGFTESRRGQPHRNSLTDLSLKIFDSRLQPHLPGAKRVKHYTMPTLGLRPANERRHYRVTPSPGQPGTNQNQLWLHDNRW